MGLIEGKPLTVRGLKTETRPSRYVDGPSSYGLVNRIRQRENKSLSKTFYWRGRVTDDSGEPQDVEHKIGPFPIVSLLDARQKARHYYEIAFEGGNPFGEQSPVPMLSAAVEIVIALPRIHRRVVESLPERG